MRGGLEAVQLQGGAALDEWVAASMVAGGAGAEQAVLNCEEQAGVAGTLGGWR